MRKFQVIVNGQAYEVDVQEITGAAPAAAPTPAVAAPVAAAPAAAPAPVAAAAAPAAPAASAPSGSESVNAPMPGTIISVIASVGQSVKKGDPLVVLEAMKMENDIPAPRDGVVAAILVSAGSAVNTGSPLVALK